jgi:hypothetical protein
MSAQPDRPFLMRAVAEVVVAEEKARVAADRDMADEIKRLRERIDELGAKRDDPVTLVPSGLAEQISNADRLIKEWPPLRTAPVPVVRNVAGAMLTRDGQLAVSYSDGSTERLGQVVGPQGATGPQGIPGRDGIGFKGDDGPAGRDGVGIVAAAINRAGELMLTMSDGSVLTPGRVTAAKK